MVRMKGSKQNFAQAVDNISSVDEDDLLDISPENVSGDQLKKRIDEELDEVIEEAEEPMLYMNSDYNIIGIGFYSSYLLKPESELEEDEPLIYYLSADNQLRFTGKQRVINAFRHGLIFRNLDADAGALTFTLNFEDGETTGIVEVDGKQTAAPAEGIYNLQGVKLNGQPKQTGVYINHGKKMVIK